MKLENLYIYILKLKDKELYKITFSNSLYKYIEYDLSINPMIIDLDNSYVFVFPNKLQLRTFLSHWVADIQRNHFLEEIYNDCIICKSHAINFILERAQYHFTKLDLEIILHKGLKKNDHCILDNNSWASMLFEMKVYGYCNSEIHSLTNQLVLFLENIEKICANKKDLNFLKQKSNLNTEWDDYYLEMCFARAKKKLLFPFFNERDELTFLIEILEKIEGYVRLDYFKLDILHSIVGGILTALSNENIKDPKIENAIAPKYKEIKMMQRTRKFSNRFLAWSENINATQTKKDIVSEYFHDQYLYKYGNIEEARLIYNIGIQNFVRNAELVNEQLLA